MPEIKHYHEADKIMAVARAALYDLDMDVLADQLGDVETYMFSLSTARSTALLEAAEIAEAHASQCRSKLNKKRSDHDLAVFESAMSEAVSIAAAIRKLAEEA